MLQAAASKAARRLFDINFIPLETLARPGATPAPYRIGC